MTSIFLFLIILAVFASAEISMETKNFKFNWSADKTKRFFLNLFTKK